jgi:hypothetical protein
MVIHLVRERQWEDVNWNGRGHRTCVVMELGTFYRLLYPTWFTWAVDEKMHASGSTGRSGSIQPELLP